LLLIDVWSLFTHFAKLKKDLDPFKNGKLMSFTVRPVSYVDQQDMLILLDLLHSYARDPMGGGQELSDNVREDLPSLLANCPGAISFFGCKDGRPVGLINCFEGISTFMAKPLLNIHDVVVLPAFRGQGLGRLMLQVAEDYAREKGFCKLTLEVLSENHRAMNCYSGLGYRAYVLDPAMGEAVFLEKKL
jgi:ribosomal protein S18 acetylase RimI-like enzyme